MFIEAGKKVEENTALVGDENRYAMNDLTPEERIEAIKSGKVHLVIIFIDEINRTENTVYKELMNILLTRSVNGYQFPWWVLFVGAMNPSTQNSIYATNEMDPAQLDRFVKIKVGDSSSEWLRFGKDSGVSEKILDFLTENPQFLTTDSKDLEDEEKPTPSPRGWDMVDTLLKSEPMLRDFFAKKENEPRVVEKDMKNLVSSKLGSSASTAFFASLLSQAKAISPVDLLNDDEFLTKNKPILASLSMAKKVQTSDLLLDYLKQNIESMMLDTAGFEKCKKQLSVFAKELDASTRLLFAQNIVASTTNDGNSMMDLLFEIFESDLFEMLELSDRTKTLIEGSK